MRRAPSAPWDTLRIFDLGPVAPTPSGIRFRSAAALQCALRIDESLADPAERVAAEEKVPHRACTWADALIQAQAAGPGRRAPAARLMELFDVRKVVGDFREVAQSKNESLLLSTEDASPSPM